MSEQFLHGVEVVQIDDGLRPIRTVRSSVIGVVGTAPDAAGATAATLTLGSAALNTALTFTAQDAGLDGNLISVAFTDPGESTAAIAVTVDGNAISVALAADAEGAITSTAAEVKTAIEGDVDAAALVAVAHAGTSDGSGVVRAKAATKLADGADEPFPLNTPVLIAGSRREAAKLDATGNGLGTLPAALDAIFDQAGAVVVVVRVEEGEDDAATQANIIGGVDGVTGDYEGLQALAAAESIVHVSPRILIAPGFTQNTGVVSEMIGIAERLRAVIIADGPNTTDTEAIEYRGEFGSDRVYIVDPWVTVFDTVAAKEVVAPVSARVAGVIARTDADNGFWWSPSNKLINGITGTARAVSFGLSDPNSRANILNENEVATIVRKDGYRLWGNRSTTADPLWAFLSVRRTADMIYESVEQAHLWAMDRPFSAQLINDIRDGVDAYLRHLKALGAILGGRVWLDPELNTEAQLKAGKLYLDFDIEPPAPLEHLIFRAHRNGEYYEELVADVAQAS